MDQRLEALDLNLLLALHWLLTERNVTKAADRLGQSQPATSRALARLRDVFDDPLLVKSGRLMLPTPRAEKLQPAIANAIEQMRGVLRVSRHFDPATEHGTFRIATKDIVGPLAAAAWAQAIAPHTTGLTLDIVDASYAVTQDLVSGQIDLVIIPDVALQNPPPGIDVEQFVSKDIYPDHYICALRKTHPLAGQTLSTTQYLELEHILINPGGEEFGIVDHILDQQNLTRRIAYRTTSATNMFPLLMHTDCITTAPSTIFRGMDDYLSLSAPPYDIPGHTMEAGWHPNWSFDPRHQWVRNRLFAEMAKLQTQSCC